MTRPKAIAHLNSSPAFPHPTHTCLRIPQKLKGRDIMVVADEDVAKLYPSPPAFTWIYDVTNERSRSRSRRSRSPASTRTARRSPR